LYRLWYFSCNLLLQSVEVMSLMSQTAYIHMA